ncbi:hypothetical protein SALBM311S_11620 [Streptomyces alboniger]
MPLTLDGLPFCTGLPLGSSTRNESADTETCSEKVSETWVGALSTTTPCWGSLPVSAACAEAGAAVVRSSPAAARSSSTRVRTRGAMVSVKGGPSLSVR